MNALFPDSGFYLCMLIGYKRDGEGYRAAGRELLCYCAVVVLRVGMGRVQNFEGVFVSGVDTAQA